MLVSILNGFKMFMFTDVVINNWAWIINNYDSFNYPHCSRRVMWIELCLLETFFMLNSCGCCCRCWPGGGRNWVEHRKRQWMQHNEPHEGGFLINWVVMIIRPLGWSIWSTFPKKGKVESKKLTVGCPTGVALGAVGGVRRGDGGHAGAPDETKGCEATCCNTTCEARGTQAWLAGSFGKQRPGRCNLGLGRRCCCVRSRSSVMGEDLIC